MRIIFIVTVCLAVIFSACKNSGTNRDSNVPGQKIKRTSFSYAGSHEAYVEEFGYDLNDRLITYNIREEDSNYSPILLNTQIFNTFFFFGTDDKPFKDSTFYIYNTTSSLDVLTYYYYDAQNRCNKYESFISGILQDRHLYEYPSNYVVQKNYSNFPGPIIETIDSIHLDNQSRIYNIRNYNSAGPLVSNHDFTYDVQNNPYYLLNIYKYLFDFNSDEDMGDIVAKNNIQTEINSAGGITTHTIITYTYNADGYPVTGTNITTDVPYSDTSYLRYEYY